MQISRAHDATAKPRFLPEFPAKSAKPSSARVRPSHKTKIGTSGIRGSAGGKTDEAAVVEIESVEMDELEPGITLAGENAH